MMSCLGQGVGHGPSLESTLGGKLRPTALISFELWPEPLGLLRAGPRH